MTDEKLYTLAEAQLKLHKLTCDREGHDYDLVIAGNNEPERILCRRCGLAWKCEAEA